MFAAITAGCGALLVVVNIFFRVRGADFKALMLKTCCGAMFVITAAAAVLSLPAPLGAFELSLGIWVLLGLFFGLLGDVWLGVKELTADYYDSYFKAGFASFGLGHLCFVIGMLLAFRLEWPEIVASAAFAAIIPAAIIGGAARLGLDFGGLKWVAASYGFLLCWTTSTGFTAAFSSVQSAGLDPSAGQPFFLPLLIAVGGVLFLISDLVLAAIYFGGLKERNLAHAACYVFYYGAQFTIALSLLALA
ncbi:MAG: lysoplasmalogenase [Propionibacteriaceae bacterium]|jgi:hypothetical protein|nr:lysoplasmalogenase [Propionibacteriaceae bacterium]